MKDVSKQTLENLISFIYCGKVNIERDALADFFKTAKALQIKGIADGDYKHLLAEDHDQEKEAFAALNDDSCQEQWPYHTASYKPGRRLSVQYQSCHTNGAQFFMKNHADVQPITLIDHKSFSRSLLQVTMNNHDGENDTKDENNSSEQENAFQENDVLYDIDNIGSEPSKIRHDVTRQSIAEPFENNDFEENIQSRIGNEESVTNDDSMAGPPSAKRAKKFKGNL